jgi:hypothetical protein
VEDQYGGDCGPTKPQLLVPRGNPLLVFWYLGPVKHEHMRLSARDAPTFSLLARSFTPLGPLVREGEVPSPSELPRA